MATASNCPACGQRPRSVPVVQAICAIGIVTVFAIAAVYPEAPNMLIAFTCLLAIALGLEYDPLGIKLRR